MSGCVCVCVWERDVLECLFRLCPLQLATVVGNDRDKENGVPLIKTKPSDRALLTAGPYLSLLDDIAAVLLLWCANRAALWFLCNKKGTEVSLFRSKCSSIGCEQQIVNLN